MERPDPGAGTPELEQYADGFVAWPGRLGYSPRTCEAQVALRRHLGRWLARQGVPLSGLSYRLDGHEQLPGSFLDSLEARGETRITAAAALAFATAPTGTARAWHAQRLAAVRSFAGYVHALDPDAADPVPGGLIPGRIPRRVPYLYSGEETARLMAAAGALASPALAASMRTLTGLPPAAPCSPPAAPPGR